MNREADVRSCAALQPVDSTPTPAPTSVPNSSPSESPAPTPTPISGTLTPSPTPIVFQGAINLAQIGLLEGATIIANDGQFLGILSADYTLYNSIVDGPYGPRIYSFTRSHAPYTDPSSPLSWYNSGTTTPPMILLNGEIVAYLTANTALSPRVEPYTLKLWLGAT